MPAQFTYDLFLSYRSKDMAVVLPLAERLRKDGLKVWFDEWVLKPSDSIPAKTEEGLEHSRVLGRLAEAFPRRQVLCTSSNAFDSDWTQLARPTVASFRRRKAGKRVKGNLLDRQSTVSDRLKKELRFTPLRLEDPTQLTRKSQSTSRVRSSQARQGKEP